MGYKAVIFDFDYTLGDCTPGIVESVNYALECMNYPLADTNRIRRTVGKKLEDTFSELTGNFDETLRNQFTTLFMEKADEVMTPKAEFLPFALDTLQQLSKDGVILGIVTTKLKRRIDAIFERHNVSGLIPFVCGSDNVTTPKPSPEGLIHTISQMGLEKKEVLYVGDTTIDAQTALNAGVDFAAVTTGTTTVSDFQQYPNVLIMEDLRPVIVLCRM